MGRRVAARLLPAAALLVLLAAATLTLAQDDVTPAAANPLAASKAKVCGCLSTTTCKVGAGSNPKVGNKLCLCKGCPATTGGTAICQKGVCDVNCNPGYKRTAKANGGFECKRDKPTTITITTECACLADTGSCVSKGAVLLPSIPLLNGTAGCPCSSCSAKGDANAVAMCVGGRCQSSCVFGTFRCDASGACLDKYASDVTSCGASCKACPKPEFGRATCVLGSCDVVCNAGYTRAVNAGKPSCTPRTLVDAVTYSNLSSPFTTWIGGYGVLAGLDSAKRTWTTRFPEAYIYGMAVVNESLAGAVGGTEFWLWSKIGNAGAWVKYEQDTGLWGAAAGKDDNGNDIVWVVGDDSWVVGFDGASNGESWWTQVPDSTEVFPWFADVTASGPNSAVAVGAGGAIALLTGGIKSSAGWRWVRAYDESVPDLNAVTSYGTDGRAAIIWAVGLAATVLTSNDGGATWTQIPPSALGVAESTTISDVTAVNEEEAWAVGSGGTILHYSAGKWASDAAGLTTQDLYAVWHDPSSGVVYAAGDKSVMLARSNNTWQVIQPPSTGAYYTFASLYGLAASASIKAKAVEVQAAVRPQAVDNRCTFRDKSVQLSSKVEGNSIGDTVTYPICPSGNVVSCSANGGQVSCDGVGAKDGCALIQDKRGAHRYTYFTEIDGDGVWQQIDEVWYQLGVDQFQPCVMEDQTRWPTGVPPATCSDPSNTDYFDASVKATAGSCDGQSDLLSGLVSPSAAWRTDASKAITATMIKLGMLSHMAYTTKQADNGVQTWSQCLGVTTANYRQIDADGAQVHVYWSDSDIVLAYRGSDGNEPNDWATNIQAALTAFTHNNAEGKTTFQVHSGFWTATQLLNEPIKKLLAEIGANAGSRHKLWFTGHSQGAALATLGAISVPRILAGRSTASFSRVGGVVAFAPPLPGDASFKSYYNSLLKDKTVRVSLWLDPIPWITIPGAGFKHVGWGVELCAKRSRYFPPTFNDLVTTLNDAGDSTNCAYVVFGQIDAHHHSMASHVNLMLLQVKKGRYNSAGGNLGCVLDLASNCPPESTADNNCDNIFRCGWATNKELCRPCATALGFTDDSNTCAGTWGLQGYSCKANGWIDSYRCQNSQ